MSTPTDLIDAEAIAVAFKVPESTIRTWASRGLIRKFPQGHRRRTLYSLAEFGRVHAGCDVHSKSACRTCFGEHDSGTLDASGRSASETG